MNRFKTPILLIFFNRLETTKLVFEQIKNIKPKSLYLASDGPRIDVLEEFDRVNEIRDYILSNITWECEVFTLFQKDNLGCKIGVTSAINWFFENVQEGIILEDDCLPTKSFFFFCQELLFKYKENKKIWLISGTNFKNDLEFSSSYYYSKIPLIWGWATWKDRWKNYDVEMKSFDIFKQNKSIAQVFDKKSQQLYWLDKFEMVHQNKFDTWDYQLVYEIVRNDCLCINPSRNLIKNIGFGEDATHTKDSNTPISKIEIFEIKFPLIAPKKLQTNIKMDEYIRQTVHADIDYFYKYLVHELEENIVVYLYGTGIASDMIYNILQLKRPDIRIQGFIDDLKRGKKNNLDIVAINEIDDDICIIIAIAKESIVSNILYNLKLKKIRNKIYSINNL